MDGVIILGREGEFRVEIAVDVDSAAVVSVGRGAIDLFVRREGPSAIVEIEVDLLRDDI